MVEDKKIMERVGRQKTSDNRFLNMRKIIISAPDKIQSDYIQGKIPQDSQEAGCYKPVEIGIMGAVEPWLESIHLRLIILLKNIHKIFLPPAEYRPLFEPSDPHGQNEGAPATLEFSSTDAGEPREDR